MENMDDKNKERDQLVGKIAERVLVIVVIARKSEKERYLYPTYAMLPKHFLEHDDNEKTVLATYISQVVIESGYRLSAMNSNVEGFLIVFNGIGVIFFMDGIYTVFSEYKEFHSFAKMFLDILDRLLDMTIEIGSFSQRRFN